MKKNKLIFSVVLPLLFGAVFFGFVSPDAANSDEEGIEFFHGTINEAKAKARQEGKLIFVDAYTTWCGPCRWMAANTFTDPDVGAFFNEHFVNMKLDMERGEGREFGQQYRVMAYPTLLFLDHTGTVKHRAMGAKKSGDFLKLGKSIISEM